MYRIEKYASAIVIGTMKKMQMYNTSMKVEST